MWLFSVSLGYKVGRFKQFDVHATFETMLATEGGDQIFKANDKILSKSMCRVLKARRRHQIAHEIWRIAGVMYTVAFADGGMEAKCARDSSHRRFLKVAWSEQRAKRTSNGAARASKSDKNGFYRDRVGGKKVRILMQNA